MKLKHFAIALLMASMMGGLTVHARMSDAEVVQYVTDAMAQGKDYNTIGRELLAKGVTIDQIQRLQQQYQASGGKVPAGAAGAMGGKDAYGTSSNTPFETDRSHMMMGGAAPTVGTVGTGGLAGGLDLMGMSAVGMGGLDLENARQALNEAAKNNIYGQNVFSSDKLTFAPSENLATPQNYTLGAGDEVIIDIWGENEEHIRQKISPEGTIMISQLGPISLSGKTIDQANRLVRERFARKFAGVGDNRSEIALNLGQVRSISVDVMGEVSKPGTFQMSPFSTVFHALYNAGGLSDIGTLRNIEVLRNGKKIANVDIYDYLFKGKQTGNIRLQEGDVIVVPPYSEVVKIDGNVRRPMMYEMKPGETVNTLINYAGGFTGDAYSDMVRLQRFNGRENELLNVERGDFSNYRLKNGDLVTVGTVVDRYSNKVDLEGQVMRPGQYAIGTDIFTLRDLINKAEGLMEDAYTGRVMIYREQPDLSLEVLAVDLGAIMAGTAPDVELHRNDQVIVQGIHTLNERGDLTIQGEVNKPGTYKYADNFTIEDLIVRADGLKPGASTARVVVSRRIIDPTAVNPTNRLAETYTLSVENGLLVGEGQNFPLKPYDVVTVYQSPGYSVQKFVTIQGEVAFSGPYALINKNERLTQVLARAGGITEHAYLRGASLLRRVSPDEMTRRNELARISRLSTGKDSLITEKVVLPEVFPVGIDLEKALANPGSEYDIVMRQDDLLFIPQEVSTVSISGDVMYPTTVTFQKGKKVKDYINMAGGFASNANKGKLYIVYLNGMVAKAKRGTPVEPGCQIVVPTKQRGTRVSVQEVMGYVSSVASIGVMAASIANLSK